MQTYRNRLRIISDVLSVALNSSGEGGASPSVLMRRSNLSYRGLEQLLSQLLSAELLLEKKDKSGVRYVVSAKGAEYLAHFHQFETFAESYGLRL
ncbi:MAG TPA: winged helix-turn-helix domain-containing protein [Nitrososphaerales archaeon]|nr:winged helix-turn-helix domain-containing protein [Nitrososphaerales archaeon]